MKIAIVITTMTVIAFFATAKHTSSDPGCDFYSHRFPGWRVGVMFSFMEFKKVPVPGSGSISLIWMPEAEAEKYPM